MKNTATIFFTVLSFFLAAHAGNAQPLQFAITVYGNYTTSAKVYPTPSASDGAIRNSFFSMEPNFTPSIDLHWYFAESLFLTLSAEYYESTVKDRSLTVLEGTFTRAIRIEEGFALLPLELSLYYRLPFSGNTFGFYLYGGGALYFGNYIRKIADVELETIERKSGYGIQVGLLSDYVYNEMLALSFGMKFRDPQLFLNSAYSKKDFTLNNRDYTLGQNSFESKINIDGVTFQLGVRYTFSL